MKVLVHRALMIFSTARLDSELDTIRQPLVDCGYPGDILLPCFKEKLANISSEKLFDPECARASYNSTGLEMVYQNLSANK